MKKLFLFVAAASLALTSCSSDDSGSGSGDVVKFTVDGTEKVYRTVVVNEDTDGDSWLTVTASNGSATEYIMFELPAGAVGADAIDYTNYFAAGDSFWGYSPEFNAVVEVNSDSRLKGTFSGTLQSNMGEATKTITNGSFNITR